MHFISGLALILAGLVAPLFGHAVEPVASARVRALEGKINYHDGPNCFNATLYAAGFLDYLAQTDNVEMEYFLDRFCSVETREPIAGDILINEEPRYMSHAALSLGGERIFE